MRRIVLTAAIVATVAGCGGSSVVSVYSLAIGDCFNDPSSFEKVTAIDTVDCSEPHDNEVYLVTEYTGSNEFPGEMAMDEAAFELCRAGFADFVGTPYELSRYDITVLQPSRRSWEDAGDREVTCAVYDLGLRKLTGTVRGSGE